MRSVLTTALLLAAAGGFAVSCGGTNAAAPASTSPTTVATTTTSMPVAADSQRFPDVIDVEVSSQGDGAFSFAVTISSPYDTPERYADAWRVLDLDGETLGTRVLTHDHAGEQPFTRSLRDVEIDLATTRVLVEARDLVHGWGGDTLEVNVPHP